MRSIDRRRPTRPPGGVRRHVRVPVQRARRLRVRPERSNSTAAAIAGLLVTADELRRSTSLIVGAGPVGLLARHPGCSRRGCARSSSSGATARSPRPAAHAINARTFEICRQAGLDMDRLVGAAAAIEDSGARQLRHPPRWRTLIGRLPYERQSIDDPSITPTPMRNLSQHRLEPILVDDARPRPAPDLRYGQQWESATQDELTASRRVVLDRAAARTSVVRSRYVIGCDGAGSPVRKSIGIEMDGPSLLQSFVMIHVAADLRRARRRPTRRVCTSCSTPRSKACSSPTTSIASGCSCAPYDADVRDHRRLRHRPVPAHRARSHRGPR